MYISKIHINGFRNFIDNEIVFNDGMNVIIGHNNAGKSNLLKSLSLIVGSGNSKRLGIDDFNKSILIDALESSPPKISIELTITQSQDEDLNSDDLVTVGNWLTKLDPPYEALLTYEFFLPENESDRYRKCLENITNVNDAWKIIEHDFLRLYTNKIFGGVSNVQNVADSESLHKFDFQFLDAIRDVERDMFTGNNILLRDILSFFMDYDIKNDSSQTDEQKKSVIKTKTDTFSSDASSLLDSLQLRMVEGKKQMLSYASETGASFNNAKLDFSGTLSETDMFSALRLIIEYETGVKIPATHNGLGYNNLIYMSLLLAKMQVNSDGNYLGSNAKVFPCLAIEEPEAHLHPAMQHKFLKFLRNNKVKSEKVRQIFVTTHSTHITSAVSLDEIICLHNNNGAISVGYPGKVFSSGQEKAKKYVQRFFDAIRSDMLFAQKVILVEGLAEQLLISTMAKYLDKSLEDEHIAVINVGGRYFDYFLPLFDHTTNRNGVPKKVVCLTDRDPVRKMKRENEGDGDFKKCYPFELNNNSDQYEYRDNASANIVKYETHPNIRFFSQDKEKGKTFEYDLILHNPALTLLITDSTSNRSELNELMQMYSENKTIGDFSSKLRSSEENNLIRTGIEECKWENAEADEDIKRAIIASRYLNSVGKGENALELAYALEENLTKEGTEEFKEFNVPNYIKEAIEWICQ
jgi:putative ATP-dependent endonuclease of the OLD family